MRLTVLGTGSALPSPSRLQTGAVVENVETTLLVDCGSGITHRLVQSDTDYRDIDTILLTHTHLDHVAASPPSPKRAFSTATIRSQSSAHRAPEASVKHCLRSMILPTGSHSPSEGSHPGPIRSPSTNSRSNAPGPITQNPDTPIGSTTE